jgi:glucoamylase
VVTNILAVAPGIQRHSLRRAFIIVRSSGVECDALRKRGDDVLATIRALTPTDGSLSEQVDRTTGRQTSAQHLTWSYAAFIVAAAHRERCTAH